MKKDSLQSGSMLTLKMVEILRDACESSETRRAALRDPRSFLSQHGLELGDDCELYLFEHAPVPNRKPGQKDHEVPGPPPAGGRGRGDVEPLSELPPGYQTYLDDRWGPNHGGCPFPLNPYKTKKEVNVCLVWGLWVSGKEWVEDGRLGHFEYSNVSQVCVLSQTQVVEVTECR
jgi:hypothetical protein